MTSNKPDINDNIIFVTGYFGAPIETEAARIAAEKDCPMLNLDEEIEKADGRSVLRICMTMGEHEYRNQEYEAIKTILQNTAQYAASTAAATTHLKVTSQTPAEASATENRDKANVASPENNPESALVICCGDGVLQGEMSAALIKKNNLVIIGSEMSSDALWSAAKETKNSYHAFIHFGDEESRRKAFDELHERQKALFSRF